MEKSIENINFLPVLKETFGLKSMDLKSYSPLTLAYIGDAIYDIIIRTLVVEKGNAPVNKLHRRTSTLVKASSQVEMFHAIEEVLTEEELGIFKRGRNAKSFTSAKNASITDYRIATGMEALVGYLYLDNRLNRVVELFKIGLIDKELLD